MSFLYFIPHVSRQTMKPEVVRRAGLGDILRDRCDMTSLSGSGRMAVNDVIRGPEGHMGVILKPFPFEERKDEADGFGYYPDRQKWQAVKVSGVIAYWIGWDPNNLPTEASLVRDETIAGVTTPLGETREGEEPTEWGCPIIRLRGDRIGLPDVWGLQNGKIVSRVRREWEWAWELSGEVWEWYRDTKQIPRETLFLWASKLLGINYRVGPEEITILGLIGRDEMKTILRIAINGQIIEDVLEEEKKSANQSPLQAASSTTGSAA